MRKIIVFALLAALAVLFLTFYPQVAQSESPIVATPTAPRDIKYYADVYGADYDLAVAIATCESQLEPTAKNPHSTAKGVYQFLDGTWRYYGLKKWGTLDGRDVLNYADNVELGVWVIARFGTKDWNASKHCWG